MGGTTREMQARMHSSWGFVRRRMSCARVCDRLCIIIICYRLVVTITTWGKRNSSWRKEANAFGVFYDACLHAHPRLFLHLHVRVDGECFPRIQLGSGLRSRQLQKEVSIVLLQLTFQSLMMTSTIYLLVLVPFPVWRCTAGS